MKEFFKSFMLILTFGIIFAHNISKSFQLSRQKRHFPFEKTSESVIDENIKSSERLNNTQLEEETMHDKHWEEYFRKSYLSQNKENLKSNVDYELAKYIPSLKTLELRNNEIKLVPKNFFHLIPHIIQLDLGNNSIQSFEDCTFNILQNLTHLNIEKNELMELNNNTFADLISLQFLQLNNNSLRSLSPGIFDKNNQLRDIDLSWNLFENIPEGLFKNNKNLSSASFHGERKLMTLPRGLFSNLKNLNSVYINGSNLKIIPGNVFQGSHNLRIIYLNKNSLQSLPEKIFDGLINLKILQLSDNQIATLPDNLLDSCINLQELYINNNNILQISKFIFKRLASLEILFMQHNHVLDIEVESFSTLLNIKEINLSHNNITNSVLVSGVNDTLSIFSNNTKLQKLDLSYNKIGVLFLDWIMTPPVDFFLNLSNNNITSLILDNVRNRFGTTKHHRKIVLNIENNPIKCDCSFGDLLLLMEITKKELNESLEINTGSVKCSNPKEYEGILLSDLKYKDYYCNPSKLELNNFTQCPAGCDIQYKFSNEDFIIDCSHRNLTQAPDKLCSPRRDFVRFTLDLSRNVIKDFPNLNHTCYNKVTHLVLEDNQITTIPENEYFYKLQDVRLQKNLIKIRSMDVVNKFFSKRWTFNINNNPLGCYFEVNQKLYNSSDPSSNMDHIFCNRSKLGSDTIIIVTLGIISLGLMIITLSVLCYYHRIKLKVWLYSHQTCLWLIAEEELDKDKIYDVFISYSHLDEQFVINELVTKLEAGPTPFKLCVHFRDWLVGDWIPSQIARSIQDSKRTIVVVSPNFVKSEWGKMEFRAAHKQALNEGRTKVIMILYQDLGPIDKLEPELKSYMTMITYLQWGDPWFWDKLRYALPHKFNRSFKKLKSLKVQHSVAHLS